MITRFFSIPVSILKSCFAGALSGKNNFLLPLSLRLPHSTFKKSSNYTKGYTLIELIVVIVLLGLMFGITVPRFRQNLLSDSLDATSLRLIGFAQDLREKAISGQVSYMLHLDIREKRIWAFASTATEEEQEAARERAYELLADVKIQDVWSWSSGKVFDEAIIRFSRKGYIEQSMIHLQSEDGREVSLELTPFLGSIKIHEGYVDFDRG
ncbi:MAG: prepilin-type N-terminal cleavage/methylation domain-containing protein [Desulfobacterales bacterium]|nr:prepilin-type N-terminal cleavage/methylation domain-containing protein [Desulfobacterales bacterium]